MKKKGFTLIELLAVIVILAVIALIATPLIMNVINDARKNSFKDSAYGIIKAVEFRASKEQMDHPDEQNREYKVDVTSDAITYSGDKPTSGWAYIDQNGNIELYMCNTSYCASKAIDNNEVTITSDNNEMETIQGEITRISELDIAMLTKDGSEGGYVKPVNNCTFDGELVQGAEYVNGQYTYRYMQQWYTSNWANIANDGWGVTLTNKESTDPVTTKLCTSINGKPIVSMNLMFYNSKTTNIDLSSFDTSNVTNMNGMFAGASGLTNLDLKHFNTSNVTNMSGMFYGTSNLTSLDLSHFDTALLDSAGGMIQASGLVDINLDNWKMQSVYSGLLAGADSLKIISAKNWKIPSSFTHVFFRNMAGGNSIQTIDVTGWDLSDTTDLSGLFANGTGLKVIKGLNTWDTSHITNMSEMFNGDSSLTSLDLNHFNTSKVTSMASMFSGMSSLTSLDLSHFDTSNVTDMSSMFNGTSHLSNLNLDNWKLANVPSGLLSGTSIVSLSAKNWKLPASFTHVFFRNMAGGNSIHTIDVTGWDLSNTTDLSGLFATNNQNGTDLQEIKGLNTWDTSNIVNMSQMFNGNSSLTSLDLSSFDATNVTSTTNMFTGLTITSGYARTQADADKFNASGGKPSTLTFTVK